MRPLLVALAVLAGCAPIVAPVDAAMPADANRDAFVAPLPSCDGRSPVCPDRYTPRCAPEGWTLAWSRTDRGCVIAQGAFGADCPVSDGPATCPDEAPVAVCVPPSMGCPE